MALSDDEMRALKDLVEITFKETAEDIGLVTRDDIKHLPNKDEFYEQTGEIIKRLDTMEEEKDVLSSQVSNHEDRIEKIESHLRVPSD